MGLTCGFAGSVTRILLDSPQPDQTSKVIKMSQILKFNYALANCQTMYINLGMLLAIETLLVFNKAYDV